MQFVKERLGKWITAAIVLVVGIGNSGLITPIRKGNG